MRSFIPVLVTLLVAGQASAEPLDWKKRLEQSLEASTYTKSDVSAVDGNRLTKEGTALLVRRTGILASPARHLGAVNTKVRHGRIEQPGGVSAWFSERTTTQLQAGDVVYLTDVEVRDRTIVLEVVTRDFAPTIERGSTTQTRYKGQVEFEFDEGYLTTVTADDLRRLFDAYFEPLP